MSLAILAMMGVGPQIALAQTWDTELLFGGSLNSDIPVGVAIRQWGPTDELFFAIERGFPGTADDEHEAFIEEWTCSTSSCSAVSRTDGPDAMSGILLHNQNMLLSMGITRGGGSAPRELRVVRRARAHLDCDGDGVDYEDEGSTDLNVVNLDGREWLWDTSTGFAAIPNTVHSDTTDTDCDDVGSSFTRVLPSNGDSGTCYRYDPEGVGKEEVWCAERADASSSFTKSALSNISPGGAAAVTQDHVSFTYRGSNRVIAHRSREATDTIRLRFIDHPSASTIDVDFAANGSDYPYIQYMSANNRFHLVWHTGAGSSTTVEYATCERNLPIVDCTDQADWTQEEVASGTGLRHASLVADGDRVFIGYMENINTINDDQFRVKIKTQCLGDDDWVNVSDETPRTPTVALRDQSLFSGRPNLAMNRIDNVVHVAFVELSDLSPTPTDGDAFWSHRTYTDCP